MIDPKNRRSSIDVVQFYNTSVDAVPFPNAGSEKRNFLVRMVIAFLKLAVFSLIVLCLLYVLPLYYHIVRYDIPVHEKYRPHIHVGVERAEHFLNQWVVQIDGGPDLASRVAKELGFHYHGVVKALDNHYIFSKENISQKVPRESHPETLNLLADHRVLWTQQQFAKHLNKRLYRRAGGAIHDLQEAKLTLQENKKTYRLESNFSKYDGLFNDEWWPMQWYEQDFRLTNLTCKKLDLGVVPVYVLLNITGHGVRLAVIDDGLELTHDDLKDAYDPTMSYNFNQDGESLMPRYEDPRNKHGTRCAGELVMKPNNTKCGVGICYGATVGGIKLLDGSTTDLIESKALNYALDKVDIYCGSWGPPDDGHSLDGPGALSKAAFLKGVKEGRGGKGVLYVFAAGNGKTFGDNCAADGYINSIYTIAIGSTREDGLSPLYSERCHAVHATTYSGGINEQVKIITVDVHNQCTCDHSGTSASAPLAAGVLALALEANPNLTWRDCQHLLTWTCETQPLLEEVWDQNSRGFMYHPAHGFGLINAYKLVTVAKTWVNVPPQVMCEVTLDVGTSAEFTNPEPYEHTFSVTACAGTAQEVKYLEHVVVVFTVDHPRRGDVSIEVTAPKAPDEHDGTKSILLEPRPEDNATTGFTDWAITTLKHWGEDPVGDWRFKFLDVKFVADPKQVTQKGTLKSLKLVLYGTKEMPVHYKDQRTYEYSNPFATDDPLTNLEKNLRKMKR